MPLVPAMYSVEITVEKDKVTGETRVLSSTTLLPRDPLPQGVKVYEDETKGMRSPACCKGTQQSQGCPAQPFHLAWSVTQNLGCVLSTEVKSRGRFGHCKALTCHSERREFSEARNSMVKRRKQHLTGATPCAKALRRTEGGNQKKGCGGWRDGSEV